MTDKDSSLKSPSRAASFRYAFAGWAFILRTQPNARIHAFLTIAAAIAGFVLKISVLEWLAVIIVMGMVWTAEFINTAVEAAVDLASPDLHPLAKTAKDTAAAGVLTSAGTALLVGIIVFGPPLWAILAKVITG